MLLSYICHYSKIKHFFKTVIIAKYIPIILQNFPIYTIDNIQADALQILDCMDVAGACALLNRAIVDAQLAGRTRHVGVSNMCIVRDAIAVLDDFQLLVGEM